MTFWSSGFGTWDWEFGLEGFRFRSKVPGLGFRVQCGGYEVSNFGVWTSEFGSGVQYLRLGSVQRLVYSVQG